MTPQVSFRAFWCNFAGSSTRLELLETSGSGLGEVTFSFLFPEHLLIGEIVLEIISEEINANWRSLIVYGRRPEGK